MMYRVWTARGAGVGSSERVADRGATFHPGAASPAQRQRLCVRAGPIGCEPHQWGPEATQARWSGSVGELRGGVGVVIGGVPVHRDVAVGIERHAGRGAHPPHRHCNCAGAGVKGGGAGRGTESVGAASGGIRAGRCRGVRAGRCGCSPHPTTVSLHHPPPPNTHTQHHTTPPPPPHLSRWRPGRRRSSWPPAGRAGGQQWVSAVRWVSACG